MDFELICGLVKIERGLPNGETFSLQSLAELNAKNENQFSPDELEKILKSMAQLRSAVNFLEKNFPRGIISARQAASITDSFQPEFLVEAAKLLNQERQGIKANQNDPVEILAFTKLRKNLVNGQTDKKSGPGKVVPFVAPTNEKKSLID